MYSEHQRKGTEQILTSVSCKQNHLILLLEKLKLKITGKFIFPNTQTKKTLRTLPAWRNDLTQKIY